MQTNGDEADELFETWQEGLNTKGVFFVKNEDVGYFYGNADAILQCLSKEIKMFSTIVSNLEGGLQTYREQKRQEGAFHGK